MRPLLLNGPPGIGKSAFVRAYAKAIGLPSLYVSLGGEADARGIAGTARGWGSTTPSIIVQSMTNHECANVIVFVDELEKAGGSRRNGDVKATLLAMLERDTARTWFDPCLQAPVDLSHINWIAGTNTVDGIPDALLSRFDVVECVGPTVEDWPIVRANMLRNIAGSLGVDVCDLPKIDAAIDREISRLLARGDMRPVKRALEQCIGLAAQADEHVLSAPRMN
jgi:ATP-dependent Lon protease